MDPQVELDSDFQNLILNNRYKFIKYLQMGTYGKVFKAVDLKSNELVSIKSLSNKYKGIANHEIEMLKQLKGNDNICQLKNHFKLSNSTYLVLQYCDYDLYEYYKCHDMNSYELYNVAKQLYNAIEFCHSKGIYHRDLKPENILINSTTNVIKLCDWGLATTKRINNEFNVGTEKYMAPEVFINNYNSNLNLQYYDAKFVDYWSFGLTLITLLFGRSPFKSINGKCLIHDFNYKKFVLYNEKQILFDIYPNLNQLGFMIFSNLFKINGIDDNLLDFLDQIKQRNLTQFMTELEKYYKFGLTVDEEEDDDLNDSDLVTHYDNSPKPSYNIKGITPNYRLSPKKDSTNINKDIQIIANEILIDCSTHLDWFDY